jgi:DNA-binding MarR family transcriptional regulator
MHDSASEGEAGKPEDIDPDELIARWLRSDEIRVVHRLLLLARKIDRATAKALRESSADLTLAEWRVLSRLVLLDKATVGQIATTASADSAEVSRAADRLETRGLVRRDENESARRRMRLLSLTAEGKRLASLVGDERRRYFTSLVDILDVEERGRLESLLDRLLEETTRRSTSDPVNRRRAGRR